MTADLNEVFPLRPPLPLPPGVAEDVLLQWLRTVCVEGGGNDLETYCQEDFRRFVYTLGLVNEAASPDSRRSAQCLELGGNPYFTTMLLRQFSSVDVTVANYFGRHIPPGRHSQTVAYTPFAVPLDTSRIARVGVDYWHFNIEEDVFPFEAGSFDVVMMCEIIEHLLMDPLRVLREIKRVLKPDGNLILTTPNVCRLENVARMLSGANIYDPYSGYGPYGRHNREYNKHELHMLLEHAGFHIDRMFSADVHGNVAASFFDPAAFQDLLKFRAPDLGQYIFIRARNAEPGRAKKPAWLYRSYGPEELDG